MKLQDLKQKSKQELQKILAEERARSRDLRFQVLSDQHKKVSDIAVVKKTIARILTVLNSLDKKAVKPKNISKDTEQK